MKVMSTEVGMETAVTSVERIESRKIRITITAKTRPSSPSWVSDSIDWVMNGAWLKTTVNVVFPPMLLASESSWARTSSETETVLPESVFVMERVRASFPSTRE